MLTIPRAIRAIHTNVVAPRLTKFTLRAPKRVEVEYGNGDKFSLSAEFLRIHSPAVDGKLRSIGGEKSPFPLISTPDRCSSYQQVISGRRHVGIMSAEPVGNYGIRIVFDDLHKTGIYTWDYFFHLGSNKFSLSKDYIRTLKRHGLSRDPGRRSFAGCSSSAASS
ncbi:unnamed protein product [Linum tenue]|uniref:Gamma-butyrobetaine hydroxylase-like N-terminal domain-containing protein n=1 Tax=Linum tenue TaxID=586396 RepID=A0AAV0NFI2_9ROSI|nr:unnamed protein product [Linum tenue]